MSVLNKGKLQVFSVLTGICPSGFWESQLCTCSMSGVIIDKNGHQNQTWCLDGSQVGQCLSIGFYLRANIMLLGNSQLYQSYQINMNRSANGSNVYAKPHHFPFYEVMMHSETRRNVSKVKSCRWKLRWQNHTSSSKWCLFVWPAIITGTKWMLKYWQSLSKEAYKVLSHKGGLKKPTKSLFWSGSLPTWQVKTKAVYAHTVSNTFTCATEKKRTKYKTKLSAGRKVWVEQIFFSLSFQFTISGRFAQFQIFSELMVRKEVLSMNTLYLCVCVCSCFPVCAWVTHPGLTPPYVGGWSGWEYLACQSACSRQNCSHNWPLCSKCHSSQRKRRDPIAASRALSLCLSRRRHGGAWPTK